MGAFSVGSIATNTSEDYIDELTTGVVYKYADYVFSGFDESVLTNSNNDVMAEALDGAKQTLKFSIMNAVIFTVTEYAISRLVIVSGAIYAYIKGTSVVSKLKNKTQGVLESVGNMGGAVGRFIKTTAGILVGSQNERLAMAQMANDNANNITHLISQERQTQVNMESSKRDQMLGTLGLASNSKNLRDDKKLSSYHYKMKTGTWENTVQDRNLFYSLVPREYLKEGFNFNSSFVSKLNSFKDYAVDSEGKLLNLAQAHVDNLAAHNFSKVQ